MRIHRSFLGWGVFFILLGAIPLAVQAGLLTADQVADWWRFWPLILVGIGLGVLLRRTSFDIVGGLVVAATFGVMLGAAASSGIAGIGFTTGICTPSGDRTAFPTQNGRFDSAAASVRIRLDCGDLTIASDDGAGWQVHGTSADGAGPAIDADGSSLSVESGHGVRGLFDLSGAREAWSVALPNSATLDIDTEVNAGDTRMDFTGATIDAFDLQLNAASSTVDLGAAKVARELDIELNAGSLGITLPASGTTGSIEANAGSVRLCTPPGVALRLQSDDSVLSSFAYDGHGLDHQGSTWQTPGFDTAAVRIDLTTIGNAASFTLDPAEGCGG